MTTYLRARMPTTIGGSDDERLAPIALLNVQAALFTAWPKSP